VYEADVSPHRSPSFAPETAIRTRKLGILATLVLPVVEKAASVIVNLLAIDAGERSSGLSGPGEGLT